MEPRQTLSTPSSPSDPLYPELGATWRVLQEQLRRTEAELAGTRSQLRRERRDAGRISARLEALLDSLPAAVVLLDRAGRVRERNTLADDLLGPLHCGTPWTEVSRRSFLPERGSREWAVLRDGRIVEVLGRPLSDDAGRVLLIREVTERHRLQESAARERRPRSPEATTAVLADRIRTPLAAARLYLSHLRRPGLVSGERVRIIERVESSLRRIETLAEALSGVHESGGPAGPAQDVSAVLDDLKTLIGTLEERVRFECPPPLLGLEVSVGRWLLAGALAALVENALHAARTQVWLEVRGGPDETVAFRVRHDGAGVPQALRAQIFEPGFTTHPEGIGLGLAVARAIAQAHGGRLALEDAPGGGAVFLLEVPLRGSNDSIGGENTRRQEGRT